MEQRKRKRCKNTSQQQQITYLDFMAANDCFRTGTTNSTLPDTYIEDKWEELTHLLNNCCDGPSLQADEWKRRFCDWKYSTKNKYRKILSQRNIKCGSSAKMTDIEEAALEVWGEVAVNEEDSHLQPDCEVILQNRSNTVLPDHTSASLNVDDAPTNSSSSRRNDTDSICDIAQILIDATIKHTEAFNKISQAFEKTAKFKEKQLEFEIAKFKHMNPDFEFDD